MGIKHFYYWFRQNFGNNIMKIKNTEFLIDKYNITTDHLLLDLNSIFHNSAQKIYCYGSYKNSYYKGGKDIDVFKDICNNIDKILRVVTPRKTLVLCVDGPAPLSKQNQQRQIDEALTILKDVSEYQN
jgi:5'-3' exonuclease